MAYSGQREGVRIDYEPRDEYFVVRVHNDDMKNAHLPKGAVVVIHKQSYADNGDIILAVLNSEMVFRYYKKNGESVYLMPANNEILPCIVGGGDSLLILGKVKEIRIEV